MRTILVYAYTEFNLGDDLFIKVLCERYPDTRFMIMAPGLYRDTFRALPNLRIIASDSMVVRGINYLFRKIRLYDFVQRLLVWRSDGIVHIGGSIFMQGEYWKEYFRKAEALRNRNKPYYLLGANFGPYSDDEYYQTHKELFKEYTDVCFREEYSYELFSDLRNVRLAPDIIFQLKVPQAQKQSQAQDKYIVLSVIRPSAKNLEGYDLLYYEKMKDISAYFIRQGYAVHLVSFCEHEGDQEAIMHILNLLPEELVPQIRSHYYKTNIEEILSLIAGSSFVVASRFHAMILGWVMNKPVFPIAYSSKMIHVMEDANFTGNYTDFNQLEDLQPEEVYHSMQDGSIDVSAQALNAERHFEKLDAYLSLPGRRAYESQTEYS
ncbi:polysaccharide pyruvyl transferase family protein [Paenibacillus sp. sgz500958]|uniref:polysaccharide pyruvyl transferase family protein n=1 Tax=Paenibacillus sp. sgz500958 TaxID=3242475 RepID=UPI0036D2808F